MSYAEVIPQGLEAACREWSNLLGAENVLRSPDVLQRYGRTTLPDAPAPVAVLLAQSTEHVAAAARVASTHKVPLYPISRGKNWGWGDACPTTEGQTILDLSTLNRIVEVNEELGYTVVQPGVTQGQLSEYLARTDSSWWFDATPAGPQTSLVGNVLERGIGAVERFSQVSGMEIVLADGTTVRTGYGHYPGSRVDHVARWGVGPSLDGLFSQSNLGIVTEIGFWLQPKAAHAQMCYFTADDAQLESVVDALRPLHIDGILSALNLYLLPRADGVPFWFGLATVRGSARIVAAYREEIEAALAGHAKKLVFGRVGDAKEPAARAATVEALGLPPQFSGMLEVVERLFAGVTPQMSPELLLAWMGGPDVQHPTEPPTSMDPLDHNYGFYFFWAACPALGREARALLGIVGPLLSAHGFPPLFTLRFVNGRSLVLVVRIAFDRKLEDRRAAARACQQAILDATIAAGYPPARMSSDSMDRLDPVKSSYWQLVRRLKGLLDPQDVLAPGRYLPPES